jgi:pimeloyl-ACP methyl ester carboxylesterase
MRELTITSRDGTPLATRCSGNGSPIVLVHGALANLDAFAPIEERLAERHSVWTYSRRGRAGSGDAAGYALEREVEDVLAVLAATGDRAHLFGHSSGAYYALLAGAHTESLRSLLLYEPPLCIDKVDASHFDDVDAALDADGPDAALATFFPLADITAAEAAAIREQPPFWEVLREGVRVFPRERRALQESGRALLEEALPPRVPVLYLYGEFTDAPVFPSPDDVRALMPTAVMRMLTGQRHLANFFDPEAFADAVLDFTKAHDA